MKGHFKLSILLIIILICSLRAVAQDDVFGTTKTITPARKGWIIGANGNFDIPAADMAKRYGLDARVGPSVLYKTASNWVFGAKFDYIFGNKIKEDSLMYNVKDQYGVFLNSDGNRTNVPTFERGYLIGLQAGKIINTSKTNADNGILLLTSAGFIQHKIDIYDKDKDVPEVDGNYVKGYDRLANGLYVEEYAGYTYFAHDGLLNFNIGLDGMFGFTQGRRDYLYDVMRSGNDKRQDILFGIRGGVQIPIFKRKSEELFF